MKVKKISVEKTEGHILVHNQAGADGRRVLKKGHHLQAADIKTLKSLGKSEVYVAMLAADDVAENEAARRIAEALEGSDGVRFSTATTGRVNLIATTAGVCKVNVEGLLALNDIEGITLATLVTNTPVEPKKIVGTIKIIPYAVPAHRLQAAETIIRDNAPLVEIKPFVVDQAALITTGSDVAREKVVNSFTPALRERLAAYRTTLLEGPYVAEDEQAIGEALRWALERGAQMILLAGETSVMDADDLAPQAIRAIGGEVVHHGVPVEPGNLLLLAYYRDVPIVGAPGCAKSKSDNVVDRVLPRLAAGERLTRRDLLELGHGGYIQ